jgi:hypothetical protein
MDNFNIQKFIKESKNDYYSKLHRRKSKRTLIENELSNDDMIEGLLNIKLKQAFLEAGTALIDDLLEDSPFEISDVTNYLGRELATHYGPGMELEEGNYEEEEDAYMSPEEEEDFINPGNTGSQAKARANYLKKGSMPHHMTEAEEGEEDVDIEMDVDMEDPTAGIDAGLEDTASKPDNKEVFSQLVDAYEAAKTLGDEKLTRQLANTITYFNKTIIFGDGK